MDIDEQVELLMQGTEYGDEALKQAMATELRERLLDFSEKRASPASLLRLRPYIQGPAPGPHDHNAQAPTVPGPGP